MKPYELDDISKVRRHKFIEGKAKKPNLFINNYFSGKSSLKKEFNNHSIICNITLLNNESVKEDRRKTEALVYIHNI